MNQPLLILVDTPVLLAAVDDAAPAQRDMARNWLAACWSGRCGRLTVQALQRFYALARQRFGTPLSAGDARAEVRRYQHWKPWSLDHATMETAWAVESRYGLSFDDALEVASAQHLACRFWLTDRLPHGQAIDSVTVLNPFVAGPEGLAEFADR